MHANTYILNFCCMKIWYDFFSLRYLVLCVVTQFWIHQDFLECYFISVILYKNPKKIKKKFKNSKIYFSWVNRIFPSKPSLPGQYGSNHVDQGKKMSFEPFRVKTVIFDQNRVHHVNTGQTMSTRIKNEFRAVSGQNRHFLPKPSSPGQYGSNHVDQDKKWVSCRFGSKLLFFFCQNPVHRFYIIWRFFFMFQHNI